MKFIILSLVLPAFAACTPATFRSTKSETLGKSVFAGDDASGVITQPEGGSGGVITQPGGGSGGVITQPGSGAGGVISQFPGGLGMGTVTQGTATGIPLKFICSTTEAGKIGTTLSTAASVQLKVMDPNGALVCDKTAGVKEFIAKNKALDLSACNLTGNTYTAKLMDPAKSNTELFYSILEGLGGFMQSDHIALSRANSESPWTATAIGAILQSGLPSSANGFLATNVGVLWASNPNYGRSGDVSDCDMTASPLVVNMTPQGQPDPGMQLSNPGHGVMFDILGLNSFPLAHTRKQISWIQNPNYMFLALPRYGRVDGIDELFGNNTQGPDYDFADNGFAALAKYDDNHDGVIDENDIVFSSLRLWSDKDFNAVSGRSELKALSEFGITSIDLSYDPDYFEQDPYGNQSRMRSIVKTSDGHMHTIFDLWFVLRSGVGYGGN